MESYAVKIEAYGGTLINRVKSGKTAPKQTPASDLAAIINKVWSTHAGIHGLKRELLTYPVN